MERMLRCFYSSPVLQRTSWCWRNPPLSSCYLCTTFSTVFITFLIKSGVSKVSGVPIDMTLHSNARGSFLSEHAYCCIRSSWPSWQSCVVCMGSVNMVVSSLHYPLLGGMVVFALLAMLTSFWYLLPSSLTALINTLCLALEVTACTRWRHSKN